MESFLFFWSDFYFFIWPLHIRSNLIFNDKKRDPKHQNNVFCGRIHIFLTRIFPISEKSALNLNSNFNLDNETRFDDEIEGETDKQLYESIWKVQDIFRSPTGIYETDKYKQFEEAINKNP